MLRRKGRTLLSALALVAVGVATSVAAPVAAAPALPYIAVGIPDEDIGTVANAGAVEIHHPSGKTSVLTAPGYQAGDRFGAVTLAKDLTGDGRDELIVGAPGRDLYGVVDAGAAYLYRGTSTGYQYWRMLGQAYSGVPGRAQAGAAFGAALGFTYGNEGLALYVGAPYTDVDGATDAGLVVGIEFSGATIVATEVLTESSRSGWEQPEAGDRFGSAIGTGALEIGAPGETVNGQAAAGAVFVSTDGPGGQFGEMLTQDSVLDEPVTDKAEAGDEFGRVLYDAGHLFVGVPGEDIGTAVNAGMVNSLGTGMAGEWVSVDAFWQGSYDRVANRNVPGAPETGDRFGAAIGGYWHDILNYPWVYVGVPGEDIGTTQDAGMMVSLNSRGIQSVPSYTDASLGGTNERGDKFGTSVQATLLSNDQNPITYLVVIGIPGENGYGVVKLASPVRTTWRQAVLDSPEAGDGYGSSVRSGR
ncbi:integrin alpha [Flindersiella endophytica]